MQIAVRCSECGNIFKQDENDMCLEIDFREKKISYICRNSQCKYENILDLSNWQKQQKHSPLPKIATM
jgi:hypothetical protein